MIGQRKTGRPRRRWNDCIQGDLRSVGLKEVEGKDRGQWKSHRQSKLGRI